jgi:hypothetical protein
MSYQFIHNIFLLAKNRQCCQKATKLKLIQNSNQNVIPLATQVDRQVNTILYFPGGRTQFGNRQPQQRERLIFLGRSEGQNGGIIGPLRNQF